MSERTTKQATTLANQFLTDVRETHELVSMYLVSGFQLKGEVMAFDDDTILFKRKDMHQLVMRSAVAVMYPLSRSKDAPGEWWRNYDQAAPGEDPAVAVE